MEFGEGAKEWMLGRVVPNSVSIVGANTAACERGAAGGISAQFLRLQIVFPDLSWKRK